MNGIFTTKEDKDTFDSYTKEQIYEAYLVEVTSNLKTQELNKQLNRKLAEVRFVSKDAKSGIRLGTSIIVIISSILFVGCSLLTIKVVQGVEVGDGNSKCLESTINNKEMFTLDGKLR